MKKHFLIYSIIILFSSCNMFIQSEKNNNHDSTNPYSFESMNSPFILIPSFYSARSLNILHHQDYQGIFSYVLSKEEMPIDSPQSFHDHYTGGYRRGEVEIIADPYRYNDYVSIDWIDADREYFLYVLEENSNTLYFYSCSTTRKPDPEVPLNRVETGILYDNPNGSDVLYSLYFPADFDRYPEKKWPLLFSYKGPGATLIQNNADFPAIILATTSTYHSHNAILAAVREKLEEIILDERNRIDRTHISTMGYSAGGAWSIPVANDDGCEAYEIRNTLALEIGDYLRSYSRNLGDKNTWILGAEFSSGEPEVLHQYIESLGGSGEHLYTLIEDRNHGNAMVPVWPSPLIYIWLLGDH